VLVVIEHLEFPELPRYPSKERPRDRQLIFATRPVM
jgi:hypothetical protein